MPRSSTVSLTQETICAYAARPSPAPQRTSLTARIRAQVVFAADVLSLPAHLASAWRDRTHELLELGPSRSRELADNVQHRFSWRTLARVTTLPALSACNSRMPSSISPAGRARAEPRPAAVGYLPDHFGVVVVVAVGVAQLRLGSWSEGLRRDAALTAAPRAARSARGAAQHRGHGPGSRASGAACRRAGSGRRADPGGVRRRRTAGLRGRRLPAGSGMNGDADATLDLPDLEHPHRQCAARTRPSARSSSRSQPPGPQEPLGQPAVGEQQVDAEQQLAGFSVLLRVMSWLSVSAAAARRA